MNTAKWKYNLKSHTVDAQPKMKEPDKQDFHFNGNFVAAAYDNYVNQYNEYLTCLRSIPVSGVIVKESDWWKDGEDVTGKFEEKKFYRLQSNGEWCWYVPQEEWGMAHDIKMFALPIKQEQQPIREWVEKNKDFIKEIVSKPLSGQEQQPIESEDELWKEFMTDVWDEFLADAGKENDTWTKSFSDHQRKQFAIKRK